MTDESNPTICQYWHVSRNLHSTWWSRCRGTHTVFQVWMSLCYKCEQLKMSTPPVVICCWVGQFFSLFLGASEAVCRLVMKAYFIFTFILKPLNQFNIISETDDTQIAILLPERNCLRMFIANFVTMTATMSAEDLTTVPFDDRAQELDYSILAVGMVLRTMLANYEDDLGKNTATRIFESVRKFYGAVVNKMVKMFPFHNDVLRGLVVLKPDPALLESWRLSYVHELATGFDLMVHDWLDRLVTEFQDCQWWSLLFNGTSSLVILHHDKITILHELEGTSATCGITSSL